MRKKMLLFLLLLSSNAVQADVKSDLKSYVQQIITEDSVTVDPKCGTHYNLLINTQWDRLSAEARQSYSVRYLTQPVKERFLDTDGGHFRLHWNDSGSDAVPQEDLDMNGIPDFIDSAAVIFEAVWDLEVNQLGYPPPPGPDGQPTSLYHIYFSQMFPLYGATYFGVADIPQLPGLNYTSYMVLDNNFEGFYSSGIDGLKVTAAHEFHHAIQLGYNVRQDDLYFYEMTSVWMEEIAYPEINDYFQYLPLFFNSVSNTRFTNFNNSYANGIFLFMLEKIYNRSIVYDIWDQIREVNSIEAIGNVLSSPAYNSSFLAMLSEFSEWLYFTGERSIPGQFFEEADQYPQVRILSNDRIALNGGYSNTTDVARYANRFYMVDDTLNTQLTLLVSGPHNGETAVRLNTTEFSGNMFSVNDPITIERIVPESFGFVLTNSASATQSYSITISTELERQISFGPNPVKSNEGHSQVVFQNIPEEADIYIFDIGGKRIAHLPANTGGIRFWELKNQKGKKVASGIYLVLIQGGGVENIKKLSILR